MKFIQTHGMGGDCTAPYDVKDYNEIVADFVGEVLNKRKNEWGYFEIDGFKFEYKYGELLDLISTSVLEKKIIDAKAHGGWTNRDYNIKTSTPPKKAVFIYKNPFKP